MDKNLQNIEDLFKEALENDEEQLPARVWNNIEHILDNDNLVSIKRKYNSLKKLATLLLFLLICFSIYEISKETNLCRDLYIIFRYVNGCICASYRGDDPH